MSDPVTEALDVTITFARRPDLAGVYRCDLDGYETAWGEDSWRKKLLGSKSCRVLVARRGGRVVGYLVAVPYSGGDRYDVIRCTVLPEYRRLGVATKLCGTLRAKPCRVILRETNLQGLLCAKALGFTAVRMLKSYFDDSDGIELVRPGAGGAAE